MKEQKFLEKFQRITSAGNFIPEIDGLRFIAIMWVVIFHSKALVIMNPNYNLVDKFQDYSWLQPIYAYGFQGVELFFAISGFILGLPFANQFIKNGRKVSLKKYFLRRLTRLEPPYIILMTFFFVVLILKGDFTFGELAPSLGASLIYQHNIIYGVFPLITVVAWSLEIEVQFYILAPLLSRVFKSKKALRRGLLVFFILGLSYVHWLLPMDTISIYQYLQYFLVGFLLADIYIGSDKITIIPGVSIIGGAALLSGIFLINHELSLGGEMIYPALIFGFYYLALTDPFWKKIFSARIITTIGGMCYSIYLIHFPFMSFLTLFSHYLMISDYVIPNLIINTTISSILAVIVSAVFFRFVERPCMDKEWPRKAAAFIRSRCRTPFPK